MAQQKQDLLGDGANLAELVARIPGSDRELYNNFRALSIQAAFDDRIFIVYKPRGLNRDGTHRTPDIITSIRCLDFVCDSQEGCFIRVQDETTKAVEEISYVPTRPFGLDLFMSIPPNLRLQWDARSYGGAIKRSMAYALLIKTRSKSDWYSADVTMCETPKNFKRLFPGVEV